MFPAGSLYFERWGGSEGEKSAKACRLFSTAIYVHAFCYMCVGILLDMCARAYEIEERKDGGTESGKNSDHCNVRGKNKLIGRCE